MHDIFFFTDVHGCYDLYRAAMDYCLEQDPECTIIFGGDACDRGPAGYKIMKELLANPQVIYLKGNHEDMFVNSANFILKDFKEPINEDTVWDYLYFHAVDDRANVNIFNSIYNGGQPLLFDWMLDGMPQEFVNSIDELPLTFSYEQLDFCHAGGRYKEFEHASRVKHDEDWPTKDDLMMLVWDRVYLGQGWMPDRTCIFGHTPTPHLAAKYYGKDKSLANVHPCAYYATLDDKWTGRKIDMDTGAIASGKLYVLNCMTMQAQGFYDAMVAGNYFEGHEVKKIEVIQF